MKDALLVGVLVIIFIFGYYLMRKIDCFLEENTSCDTMDEENET